MIFKQLSPSRMDTIDRNVRKVLKAMELSSPDYQPSKELDSYSPKPNTHETDTDLNVLGKLMVKSGAVVAATGIAIEMLPESADTVSHLTLASGLGAAAIGAAIIGYENVSQ